MNDNNSINIMDISNPIALIFLAPVVPLFVIWLVGVLVGVVILIIACIPALLIDQACKGVQTWKL